MNREILEKHFSPEQIKQREGHFGRTFDYVEGHLVIQRLNDAFNSEWSFSILEREIIKETDEVLVLGQLRTESIVKTQFGSSRITRSRESGEMVSLADDFKAAGTDSLKKCSTMLGVGLHLYHKTNSPMGQNVNGGNGNSYRSQGPGKDNHPDRSDGNGGNGARHSGNGNGNGDNQPNRSDGNGRLSAKQYKYLLQLNEDRGRNKAALDQFCLEAYGVGVEYLSKSSASNLIKTMLPT